MMADIVAVTSIKEEPLDDENAYMPDYGMSMTAEEDADTKDFFHANFKSMQVADKEDRLQIVDEQDDMIIMNASSFKSKNELDFIEKLKRGEAVNTCSKCQAIFDTLDDYKLHVASDRCILTPHLYPCAKLCGCYFKTAEASKKHEEEEHTAQTAKEKRRPEIVAVKPTTTVRYKLKSR